MDPATTSPSDALLDPSDLPYHLPRYADISEEDYLPAIVRGMADQVAAIESITADPAPPDFQNTLVPLELSGVRLTQAVRILKARAAADTNDGIDAIDAELAPRLAAHHDRILLDPALYARVKAVADGEEDLDPESAYLLERYLIGFRLAGAGLDDAGKARLREINARISELSARFKIALQQDSNDLAVIFDDAAELDGLTRGELSAARAAATERGLDGRYVVSLVLPTAHPYLSSLSRPESRARLSAAQRSRGSRDNDHDTRTVLLEILRLRAEQAQLLGFANHAEVRTADSVAKTPEAVREMLGRLAAPAGANARRELATLEAMAGGPIDAADWPFWAERVRAAEHDVDLAALRPYLEADRVLRNGVFGAAERLYGLSFTERPDLDGYHPDVRIFEVREEDGSPVGLFLLDLYARESKRGGAWNSTVIDAASLTGTDTAVVANNLNVPKPAPGEPTLLTLEQARTLFHEFGHALHGMLGRSRYPELSGTSVARDWVEFPSQLNEMWLLWPETLADFAVHVETGEPIPATTIDRLIAAESFNQGFATSEYLAAAWLDQAWHSLSVDQVPTSVEEIAAFEAAALADVSLDNPAIPPRYSTPYFAHIFASGYSASYYAYIWAEMYDADTAEWFRANGGLTRENGDAYRANVIGFGGTREPLAAYAAWRGRTASIEPLLKRRRLTTRAS